MTSSKPKYPKTHASDGANAISLGVLKRRRKLLQDKVRFWEGSVNELKQTKIQDDLITNHPAGNTSVRSKNPTDSFVSQLLKANDTFMLKVRRFDSQKLDRPRSSSTGLDRPKRGLAASSSEVIGPSGLSLFNPFEFDLVESKSLPTSLRFYKFLGSCQLFSFSIELTIDDVPLQETDDAKYHIGSSAKALIECASKSLVHSMLVQTSPWVSRETKTLIDAAVNSKDLPAVVHGLSEYAILCQTRSQIFDLLEAKFFKFISPHNLSAKDTGFDPVSENENIRDSSSSSAHVTKRAIFLSNGTIGLTISWHISFNDLITTDPVSKVFLVINLISPESISADKTKNWKHIADKGHDIFDGLIKRFGVFKASCIIADIILS